ncbi:gem-associated protein 6-like [Phymastichus coffea]|uniref:gem-associated protein 6-like n=1 Tax=Phymastichus coffea TaxID=108790 RepID=UPI00273CD0F4|nr:gem-associated protein 6-like [Phymastichus coffea]
MACRTSDSESNLLHKIYTSDPIAYKNYVNKTVIITTQDFNVYTGIVYTVDPVSESFVLLQPRENAKEIQMKIVVGSSIKNIECSSDADTVLLPELFVAPEMYNFTQEEIIKRKELITKILLDNRFPVTEEEGILCIEDTVKIEPPYQPENCICFNSIILNRIQTLLARNSI